MGNLSLHMLHNFYIVEPTSNCVINKATKKSSSSSRVKRRALVYQLILWMLKPFRPPVLNKAFHVLLGDIFSFSRRDFCGQLGANSVCLCPPASPSCDQLCYRSCCLVSLDLTNTDHNIIWTRIFCSGGLKIFFCIGVVP